MKNNLTLVFCALYLLLALGTHPARCDQPHYYMLLEEGNERTYTRNYSGAVDFYTVITDVSDGIATMEETIFFLGPMVQNRYYHMADSGDVWELPFLDSPQEDWNLVLDMPLTPGKSWGETWGEFDENFWRYSVVGPETVYTPYGELTAVKINYDYQQGNDWEFGSYWYADGWGKVRWLYSCFSCEWTLTDVVIGVDETTFDSLKALYR